MLKEYQEQLRGDELGNLHNLYRKCLIYVYKAFSIGVEKGKVII